MTFAPAPAQPVAAPGRHLSTAQPLDVAVAATMGRRAPWASTSVAAALGIVVPLIVLVIVVAIVGTSQNRTLGAAYGVGAEAMYGAVAIGIAWRVARRYGGYRPAFGFDRPRLGDTWIVLGWAVVQFVARIVVSAVLVHLIPYLDHARGNLHGTGKLSTTAVVLVGAGAVICAPIAEEFATRGVLLRSFMRRLPFVWAALLSSLIFGALHLLSVGKHHWIASAILLVPVMTVFGFLQCVLVRRTGRLGPAMAVHGLTNLVSLTLAIATAG